MGDATVKSNAAKKQRSVIKEYFYPAIMGAMAGIFLFQFVPGLMLAAMHNIPIDTAAQKTIQHIIRSYEYLINGNSKASYSILAWPFFGAAVIVFMRRLYVN